MDELDMLIQNSTILKISDESWKCIICPVYICHYIMPMFNMLLPMCAN